MYGEGPFTVLKFQESYFKFGIRNKICNNNKNMQQIIGNEHKQFKKISRNVLISEFN